MTFFISLFPFCRYRQLKQQHELKVEEEQILQTKLQQSSFHQQQEELERLQKAIGLDFNFSLIEGGKAGGFICSYFKTFCDVCFTRRE